MVTQHVVLLSQTSEHHEPLNGQVDPSTTLPSPRGSTTCAEGSQGVRVSPHSCHVPPPSRANRQSCSGWVACPCDVEVASPGPHLPRRAQSQALQPPCRGLEHQAHTSPRHVRQRRTTMEQAGVPPPPRHTRAHTHRHGGISRPRAPPRGLGAVNSPVGLVTGHPGTAAQSGLAGKAAWAVGRRPGEALTQPNPTPPLPYHGAGSGLGGKNAETPGRRVWAAPRSCAARTMEHMFQASTNSAPQNMTKQSNTPAPAPTPEHRSTWNYSHTTTLPPTWTLPAARTTLQTTFSVALGLQKRRLPHM